MRVMEIREQWSVDHIVAAEYAEPVPGPTQIRLRMKAASLNYRDHVLVRRGYGQRWKAETVMSVTKRRWGDALSARREATQRGQALLRGVVYNLNRLLTLGCRA